MPLARSLSLLQRHVLRPACLTTSCTRQAWTKPWNKGDPKLWAQGIFDYRYRWARAKKVAKVQLPDFDSMRKEPSSMTPDEMRSSMKEKGIVPPRMWDERPIVVTCSGSIIDPFDPDAPPKSMARKTKDMAMKAYSRPVSKITRYLPDFDRNHFAENDAVNIYRKAHELLAQLGTCEDTKVEETDLLQYVTETCYPQMLFRVDRKTIHWKWLRLLHQPEFVCAKIVDGADTGVVFGQVTIKLHSQQILAIYDRFGRLIHGSENVVKDVLEYVVYENFLTNSLGQWRIHGKILPKTAESLETRQTFRMKN